MRTEDWAETNNMDNVELQRFQRYLEIHQEEALRSLSRLGDETRTVNPDCPQDPVDLCTSNLSKESLFQRTSERRRFLHMIEAALARIQHGTFGVCVACGEDINPRRLDALPWTEYCLHCQQGIEHGKQTNYLSTKNRQRVNLKKAG
jgi:DnaK suppressor protein